MQSLEGQKLDGCKFMLIRLFYCIYMLVFLIEAKMQLAIGVSNDRLTYNFSNKQLPSLAIK